DVGVCVRDKLGALQAVFRGTDGMITYAPEALPTHEPAFAVTVHKGQGSEYRQVLLALPEDSQHPLLSKEIVYTGLTRAKDLVVIYAQADVLRAAIASRSDRSTGSLWST